MGVRYPSFASNTIVNATAVTTAETVIVTSPPISPSLDSAVIVLIWFVEVSTGASTTSITMRLRRGTTTGGVTINNAQNCPSPLGTTVRLSGSYFDVQGPIAGQQYSLTYQQNGATGNATINDVALVVFSL